MPDLTALYNAIKVNDIKLALRELQKLESIAGVETLEMIVNKQLINETSINLTHTILDDTRYKAEISPKLSLALKFFANVGNIPLMKKLVAAGAKVREVPDLLLRAAEAGNSELFLSFIRTSANYLFVPIYVSQTQLHQSTMLSRLPKALPQHKTLLELATENHQWNLIRCSIEADYLTDEVKGHPDFQLVYGRVLKTALEYGITDVARTLVGAGVFSKEVFMSAVTIKSLNIPVVHSFVTKQQEGVFKEFSSIFYDIEQQPYAQSAKEELFAILLGVENAILVLAATADVKSIKTIVERRPEVLTKTNAAGKKVLLIAAESKNWATTEFMLNPIEAQPGEISTHSLAYGQVVFLAICDNQTAIANRLITKLESTHAAFATALREFSAAASNPEFLKLVSLFKSQPSAVETVAGLELTADNTALIIELICHSFAENSALSLCLPQEIQAIRTNIKRYLDSQAPLCEIILNKISSPGMNQEERTKFYPLRSFLGNKLVSLRQKSKANELIRAALEASTALGQFFAGDDATIAKLQTFVDSSTHGNATTEAARLAAEATIGAEECGQDLHSLTAALIASFISANENNAAQQASKKATAANLFAFNASVDTDSYDTDEDSYQVVHRRH